MLESALTKKIRKKLRAEYGQDLWHFKSHGAAHQIAGLPDLMGCYRGYFIAMEVKKPGAGDATQLQAFTLQQIRTAGGYATVIHSFEEARDFLSTVPEPPQEAAGVRD